MKKIPNSPFTGWRDKVAPVTLLSTWQNKLVDIQQWNTPTGIAFQAFHCDPFNFNRPCWVK